MTQIRAIRYKRAAMDNTILYSTLAFFGMLFTFALARGWFLVWSLTSVSLKPWRRREERLEGWVAAVMGLICVVLCVWCAVLWMNGLGGCIHAVFHK